MVARADILAGRAVIFIDIQDTIEKQLRSIRSKLRMFTAGISEIGGDLFRGGAAGSIASYFPVKEFVNFQDQLLFLQTKLQVTDAQLKPLEKKIRDLGMSTSFSSTEVGKAATMFAQAGFSLQETSDALQASLDLARGSQVDLTTSTTILANAIRTFGADASEAADYASKFIAAARLGTLDLVDLGQSLTYSSGTFAQLGVDIEYVLGLITTLSKSGLKASLAGTSLNTAFLNLSGSADELQEKLGVALTMQDFEEPLVGLTKIQLALDKLSKFDQLRVVQELVNIRGGRAIFGTFLQGLDSLQKVTDQIRNSTDEARLAAIKLDSRLGGVGRRAVSAFQELQLAIGSTAEGPLTVIGERAAAVFNDMSRLAQINPRVTQTLLIMGPAALAAGVGLLTLTTIAGKLAMLLTPLMMLNGVVFQLAGNLAGLIATQFGNIRDGLLLPLTSIRKELKTIAELEEKTNKKRAAYSDKESKKGLAALRRAEKAEKAFKASAFWTNLLNSGNLEIRLGAGVASFLTRLELAFSGFFRSMSGSPFKVPNAEFQPFQPGARGTYGTTPFSGRGLGFDPRVFAPTAARSIPDAPIENVTKALNRVGGLIVRPFRDLPEAAQQTRVASQNLLTYTKMLVKPVGPQAKFRQMDLPLQFEFDFNEAKPLTSFLKTAPATAQFNEEAENLIAKIVQRVLGGKVSKRELSRSGNRELELQKRIASALRKFPVPPEVIPRILNDVTKQLNAAKVKPPKKFIQQLFDFGDTVEDVIIEQLKDVQIPLPLTTDLPKQRVEFKGYLAKITRDAAQAAPAMSRGLIPSPQGGALSLRGGGQIIEGTIRSRNEIGAARQMGRGISSELSRAGKAGAALRSIILDTVRILGEMGRNTVRILVDGMTNVLTVTNRVFSFLGSSLRSVGRFVTSTNWLRGIIQVVTGLGRFLRGIFTVLNGIRRVVFSLSGFLTIVEVLILFGDKIPVVKDILEGLGKAFSNLFKNLGDTLKALGPSFQLIGRGFNDMFGGNAERGLERIKGAFSDIGATIRTGVWAAWQQFLADIAPGADRIKEVVKGVIATFNALIASIGGVFGTALEGGEIVIKGDATLMETLSNVFSTENIKSFFVQLVAAIESIGLGLISAVGFIGNVLIEIRKVFMAILKGLGDLPIFGGAAREALADINAPTGDNAARIKELQEGIFKREALLANPFAESLSTPEERAKIKEIIDKARTELASLGGAMPTAPAEIPKIDVKAQQEELRQTIAEIVAGMMETSTSPTPEAAGAAAQEAAARGKARNTAASIIDNALPGIASMGEFIGTAFKNSKPLDSAVEQAAKNAVQNMSDDDYIRTYLERTASGKAMLDKVRGEIDTDDPLQWLLDSDYFLDLERGVSPKADFAKDVFGDPDEGWWRDVSNIIQGDFRTLYQKAQNLSAEDIKAGASDLWGVLKSAFGMGDKDAAIKDQLDQAASMKSTIGKAIVGDFQSTRGSMLQMVPRMEKLQEKANDHLGHIDGNLASLTKKTEPFVYQV